MKSFLKFVMTSTLVMNMPSDHHVAGDHESLRSYIAKVGLGRNPASCSAGAGSRPLEMALKWPKKGYIPFIASYNCLN